MTDEDRVVLVPSDPLSEVVLQAIIAWLEERHDARLEWHVDGRVTIHDAATVFHEYAGFLTEAVGRHRDN